MHIMYMQERENSLLIIWFNNKCIRTKCKVVFDVFLLYFSSPLSQRHTIKNIIFFNNGIWHQTTGFPFIFIKSTLMHISERNEEHGSKWKIKPFQGRQKIKGQINGNRSWYGFLGERGEGVKIKSKRYQETCFLIQEIKLFSSGWFWV